jgi:hypothetical protein
MSELRQDPDRVPGRVLWVGGAHAVLVIVASVAVVVGLAFVWRGRVVSNPGGAWEERVPAGVSHVASAPYDRTSESEREARAAHERLSTYGWVDRANRRIHVPIDVATELYLQEGAP